VRHHSRETSLDLDVIAIFKIGHSFGGKHCERDGSADEASALR